MILKKKADYIILSTLTMKFSRHDFRIIIKTKTKKKKKKVRDIEESLIAHINQIRTLHYMLKAV